MKLRFSLLCVTLLGAGCLANRPSPVPTATVYELRDDPAPVRVRTTTLVEALPLEEGEQHVGVLRVFQDAPWSNIQGVAEGWQSIGIGEIIIHLRQPQPDGFLPLDDTQPGD